MDKTGSLSDYDDVAPGAPEASRFIPFSFGTFPLYIRARRKVDKRGLDLGHAHPLVRILNPASVLIRSDLYFGQTHPEPVLMAIRKKARTERKTPLLAAIEETKRRVKKAYGSRLEDWDPLIELSLLGADRTLPEMERFQILKEVAEYWYPKQKALEIDVNLGGPTGVLRVPSTPEDWTESAAAHRERVIDGDFSVDS